MSIMSEKRNLMSRKVFPTRHKKARFVSGCLFVAAFAALFATNELFRYTGPPPSCTHHVIATLTTTKKRIHNGFFFSAVRSVLRQNYPCLEIWAFVPEGAALEQSTSRLHRLAVKYRRRLAVFTMPHDPGSIAKVMFTLEALTWPLSGGSHGWLPSAGSTRMLGLPLIESFALNDQFLREYVVSMREKNPYLFVCDDDRFYHGKLVSSFLASLEDLGEKTCVGARGWRIRRDLVWGVSEEEYDQHVVRGWCISRPYRVGVLVAVNGYLFPVAALANSNVSDFARAPPQARLMDDIWIMGQLAAASTPKYVVPHPGDAILCGDEISELDGRTQRDVKMNRHDANNVALNHFRSKWEQLWYHFDGAGEQPEWTSIWHKWSIQIMAQLHVGLFRIGLL